MAEQLGLEEKICFRDTGLVILKPDTIQLFLDNLFIRDLDEVGLQTVFRQIIQFSPGDIRFLYPEWLIDQSKFTAITTMMTEAPSMLLLVNKPDYQGSDLHDYIKTVKGRSNVPGVLRNRYIHIFEDELREMYPDKERFELELNKNRIHSPENMVEAMDTLKYLWPRLDQHKLSECSPKLYGILRLRIIEKAREITHAN